MKIKKNDQVKMLVGEDRGKMGKVLRSFPNQGKIIVEGLNLVKRHKKSRKEGEKGQRVDIPRAVMASNAMLICSKCGKETKVSYKISSNSSKRRICKKCGGEI